MAEAFKGSERVEAKKESRDFSSELKIWENLSGGSPVKISTKPALGPV